MSEFVYVAIPQQPESAYALCVDDPQYRKDTAKCISEWICEGAEVKRVTRIEGVAMLDAWLETKRDKQGDLL